MITKEQKSVAKSITAYYLHGYRQWGIIGNDVINRNRAAFYAVHNAYKQVNGKSHADLAEVLDMFYKSILASRVMQNPQFARSEVMVGASDGRRLGIIAIMVKLRDAKASSQE